MGSIALDKWERSLDQMLGEIDDILEEMYGGKFCLHPTRSPRGKTSQKSQDGLIQIKSNFSLGFGSELGEGYVIAPRFATLDFVPVEEREKATELLLAEIRKRLPLFFPGKELSVDWEGKVLKIYGDLSF